jgi:hypothetical protein
MNSTKNIINTFGASVGLDWFTEENLGKELVKEIKAIQSASGRNLRITLLSIFAAIEYLYNKEYENEKSDVREIFSEKIIFQNKFLRKYADIEKFVIEHGCQKSFPQRAFVFLDQLNEIVPEETSHIHLVEFGAAAGFLGHIFEYPDFHIHTLSEPKNEVFRVKKKIKTPHFKIDYHGYDLHIPSQEILPYFIWDLEKRERVQRYMKIYRRPRHLYIKDMFTVLDEYSGTNDDLSNVYFITSCMLYQLSDEAKTRFQDLMTILQGRGATWLDLSRHHHDIPWLEVIDQRLEYNHNYLSVDGIPRKRIIDGSEDCSNWTNVWNVCQL